MTAAPYESEDALHELLLAQPTLLAGRRARREPQRRWALVLRGTGVADGSGREGVSLFVDQDGVPTLVSVRRSVDDSTRRELVGQVIDLVANGLSGWSIASLQATYETTQRRLGVDPHAVIGTLCDDPEITLGVFFGRVEANLLAGRIRIMFVADEVPEELVRVAGFLNEQMSPAEVSAVDVTRYRSDAYAGSVIVPAPRHAAGASNHRGPALRERAESDRSPHTRELLDRISELAAASHFELVESPEAVLVRSRDGAVLAVVDLVWDALEVPMAGIPAEQAHAAGLLLSRLTHKKLSATDPSVPAHNVVGHWDDVRVLLQQLADARRGSGSNGWHYA